MNGERKDTGRVANPREEADARRTAEARETLERLSGEAETVGSSQLARMGDRARDHFMGADAPAGDAIEIWGRRIGRLLALAFVIFLCVHLYNTYIAA